MTGAEFIAWPEQKTSVGDRAAVTVKVEGQGHYMGQNTLVLESGDEFGRGFIVR